MIINRESEKKFKNEDEWQRISDVNNALSGLSGDFSSYVSYLQEKQIIRDFFFANSALSQSPYLLTLEGGRSMMALTN